jgi:hypothetical protein
VRGWRRIAIVASVLWFVGGGIWIDGQVMAYMAGPVGWELRQCFEANFHQPPGTHDWQACNRKFLAEYPAAVAGHWGRSAAFALVPIPVFWLIGCVLVVLGGWIRAGFARDSD